MYGEELSEDNDNMAGVPLYSFSYRSVTVYSYHILSFVFVNIRKQLGPHSFWWKKYGRSQQQALTPHSGLALS